MGYQFKTNGDTETIVHGYEAWGTGVFERLRGMFAIAIWDARKSSWCLRGYLRNQAAVLPA